VVAAPARVFVILTRPCTLLRINCHIEASHRCLIPEGSAITSFINNKDRFLRGLNKETHDDKAKQPEGRQQGVKCAMRSARPHVPRMPSHAPAPTALRANADIHSLLQQPICLPIPSDVLNPQFGQTHRVKFGKTHRAEPKGDGRLHPRSCSRQQRHRLMGNSPPSPALPDINRQLNNPSDGSKKYLTNKTGWHRSGKTDFPMSKPKPYPCSFPPLSEGAHRPQARQHRASCHGHHKLLSDRPEHSGDAANAALSHRQQAGVFPE